MFNNKKFIYGSGSVLFLAVFLVIIILVNMIVGILSDRFNLKLDLTSGKIYDLSSETIDVLESLNKNIDIIVFEESGMENEEIRELLHRYDTESKYLSLKFFDPVQNPASTKKYNTINSEIKTGSVVFDNGATFKIVNHSDVYQQYTADYSFLQAESKYTSAILSLMQENSVKVAVVNGHGETDISDFETIMKDENMSVNKINISTDGISNDYDMLIVVSPQTDYSAEEIEILNTYLKNGGNAQFYIGASSYNLPRLFSYISDWGVVFEDNVVLEGDTNRILGNQPYNMVPVIKEHEITNAIISNKLYVAMNGARSLTTKWDAKNGITLTTLLETTEKGMISSDGGNATESGVFDLSVLATKTTENSASKVLFTGSSIFLDSNYIEFNKDFILNSINWQVSGTEMINIRPKNISDQTLNISKQAIIIWMIILIAFIPLLVIVSGVAVWIRRRHL